jgi:hypothetical protein
MRKAAFGNEVHPPRESFEGNKNPFVCSRSSSQKVRVTNYFVQVVPAHHYNTLEYSIIFYYCTSPASSSVLLHAIGQIDYLLKTPLFSNTS